MHQPSPAIPAAKSAQSVEGNCVGTPDAPAFQPRPVLFLLALLLFAAWMGILIYWSVRLHSAAAGDVPATLPL